MTTYLRQCDGLDGGALDEIGVDGVQNLLLQLPGVGRPLGARQELRGIVLVHQGVAQFDVVGVVVLRSLPLDLVRAVGENDNTSMFLSNQKLWRTHNSRRNLNWKLTYRSSYK